MILCNQCLFIHIPKCAGTSVRSVILGSGLDCHLLTRVNDPDGNLREDPNQFNPHVSPASLLRSLGESILKELLTFTFVRNPWERYVSWWSWRKDSRTFEQFLRELIDPRHSRTDSSPRLPGNPPEQQAYFSRPDLYRYIGQVERMDDCWHDLRQLLIRRGFRTDKLPNTLPVTNTSDHDDYRTYYTDDLVELVARREPFVIDRFGYQF